MFSISGSLRSPINTNTVRESLIQHGTKESALRAVLGGRFMLFMHQLFNTNYLQAVEHFLDLTEAQTKLNSPDLSFDERKALLSQALATMAKLEILAEEKYKTLFRAQNKFDGTTGMYSFDFDPDHSVGNPQEPLPQFSFSAFNSDHALECWKQIQSMFPEREQVKAMQILDDMFVPHRTLDENLKNFSALAKLTSPEDQKQFKVALVELSRKPDKLNITLFIGDKAIPSAGTYSREYIVDAMSKATTGKYRWNISVNFSDKTVSKGCDSIHNFITAPKLAEQFAKESRAATTLQAAFRSHRVRGTKAHPKAMTYVLRNSDGTRFIGKGGRNVYKMPDGWREMPALTDVNNRRGACKKLTHRGGGYVGLTYHDSILALSDRTRARFNTFNEDTLQFIRTNKLTRIVPQVAVNKSQLMSKDVGSDDLHHESQKPTFVFSTNAFMEVAAQLDKMHQNNFVHRDIKPLNMALSDGHVHLLDLDTAGKVGTFADGLTVTTKAYIHPDLQHGYYNNRRFDGTQLNMGKLVDQYSFLASMLSISQNARHSKTGQYSELEIRTFVAKLPCSGTMKDEVADFLQNPLERPLRGDLADYLTAPVS